MWIQKLIFIFDDIHIFDPGSGYYEKIPNSCKPSVWDFCFALPVHILSAFYLKRGNNF